MKIVEMNKGEKISYSLDGTMLDFANGALALDLARYQQNDSVSKDIMVDADGYLTTGKGRYYAAQIEIPAREYEESKLQSGKTNLGQQDRDESIERVPLPLDTDKVTLHLFSIDGIIIH